MQVQQNTSELKKQLHHHVSLPCRVGLVASLRDNVIVVDKILHVLVVTLSRAHPGEHTGSKLITMSYLCK